jgi:GxxExxY protein
LFVPEMILCWQLSAVIRCYLWQTMDLEFMSTTCSAEEICKETTFQIIAAVIEVHKTLGYGFLESIYKKALLKELRARGFQAESQKEIQVYYKGDCIGIFYADILVNNQIILELKAVELLSKAHEAQILNYLKATGLKLGLLINFGREKAEYRRFVL